MNNRIVKFRGKTRKGTIVFGSLLQYAFCTQIGVLRHADEIDFVSIIPDSASQFTGLKTKSGVEIYENDIFNYKKHNGYLLEDFQGEVAFEDGCFGYKVITGENYKQFTPFSDIDCLQQDFLDHVEVVFS